MSADSGPNSGVTFLPESPEAAKHPFLRMRSENMLKYR